jgi:hypothetical protein
VNVLVGRLESFLELWKNPNFKTLKNSEYKNNTLIQNQ